MGCCVHVFLISYWDFLIVQMIVFSLHNSSSDSRNAKIMFAAAILRFVNGRWHVAAIYSRCHHFMRHILLFWHPICHCITGFGNCTSRVFQILRHAGSHVRVTLFDNFNDISTFTTTHYLMWRIQRVIYISNKSQWSQEQRAIWKNNRWVPLSFQEFFQIRQT